MKYKNTLIFFLTVVLIISLMFLSGCMVVDVMEYLINNITSPISEEASDTGDLSEQNVEALNEAMSEADEQIRKDPLSSFPKKTVRYHVVLIGPGYEHLEGLDITIIVNFQRQDIRIVGTGGEDDKYFQVPPKRLDMDTLEFYAYVGDYEFIDDISGKISEDLSKIEGSILSQSIGHSFTAYRK